MGRALRWQTVVPSLAMLLVALLAAQWGLARLVCALVEQRGQESVGAQVDVGEAQVSLLAGRVSLGGISVANPQSPLRNLVEVERCDLYFDPIAALYKRTEIDRGTLAGIRFGTPRKTSGQLHETDGTTIDASAWLDNRSAAAAEAWLERLYQQFSGNLVEELQSVRLTNELLERWPERHARIEKRVRELRERATELHAMVRDAQANPLRHVAFLEKVPDEITRIREDVAKLNDDIERLPSTVEKDRRAIVAARQHDETFLAERLQIEAIDGNLLTAYLLQQQLRGPLADVVGWLRWMRQLMPAEAPTPARAQRGDDLLFAGCKASPDLLVRELELRGMAQIGEREVQILGVVTNIASEPRLHGQPLHVRLTTNGPQPFEIQATIDRTGPVARDQLLASCGGIVVPKVLLGGSKKLRLSVEPTSSMVQVSILVEGDRLSGDIQLVQQQVQISPSTDDTLAKIGVNEALKESLADIGSLATRVSLAGTLDQPRCEVWSNLGTATAEAMQKALARAAQRHAAQVLVDSQRRVDERLTELERRIVDEQSTLVSQLGASHSVTAALAGEDDRPLRLTPEHLGRRLPADSLFR